MPECCKRYLMRRVRPNMVLAKPVTVPGKNILLREDTVLTQRMIDMPVSSGCQTGAACEPETLDDTAMTSKLA